MTFGHLLNAVVLEQNRSDLPDDGIAILDQIRVAASFELAAEPVLKDALARQPLVVNRCASGATVRPCTMIEKITTI